MNNQRHRQMLVAGFFITLALSALLINAFLDGDSVRKADVAIVTDVNPLLAIPMPPESPFLNISSEADYVGSEVCAQCHREESEAFASSRHHQSMLLQEDVNLPESDVEHTESGYAYQAQLRDGQMVHSEALLAASSRLPTREALVTWVMGSGRFGHSFLVEDDGFLLQSPLTWYSTRQCWDLSPGYDDPNQMSFRRTVSAGCLFCHAGIVDVQNQNDLDLRVIEPAIGCERCHGPGSLHVEWHEGTRPELFSNAQRPVPEVGETDYSIVNPARLDRDLRESVCQQCHLQGDVQTLVRGRRHHSFRPGLPLSMFRQEYRIAASDDMTIVGHVEQLQQSACYGGSETMTCTTCHDPHVNLVGDALDVKYRNACLQCHDSEHCASELTLRDEVGNRCVHCHMPSSPTEIPHVAFTHHRIGIHSSESESVVPSEAETSPSGTPRLIGLQPKVSPEADDRRCRGLAWLTLYFTRAEASTPEILAQSQKLLQQAWDEGARDAAVAAALAQIAAESGWDSEVEFWTDHVLRLDAAPSDARLSALNNLGRLHFRRGEYEAALSRFEELTAMRREAGDWFYRGLCEQNLGQTESAITSLNRALRCDPSDTGTRSALIALYEAQGDEIAKREHQVMLKALTTAESRGRRQP